MRILINGTFSVYVFFVLSGFVLAESASRTTSGSAGLLTARLPEVDATMTLSLIFSWFLLSHLPDLPGSTVSPDIGSGPLPTFFDVLAAESMASIGTGTPA